MTAPWIVCQIGAREHYALAGALRARGLLEELVTDLWALPGGLLAALPGVAGARATGRFSSGLADAPVRDFSARMLAFETARRLAGGGWPTMMRRNALFDRLAARHVGARLARPAGPRPTVFAYAYAARETLRAARAAGAFAVLGQIDGGPCDSDLVAALGGDDPRPPERYWASWREEIAAADAIVVNSRWSRDLLLRAGADAARLVVAPPIFALPRPAPARAPRGAFTAARPLRVLCLGVLSRRKGVFETIEAARALGEAPVTFRLVGPDPHGLARRAGLPPNLTVHGPVPRGEVSRCYDEADLFLLPTFSDGFGLTQLEAQAHGLPVIASRRCGEVVEDGLDGFLLEEPSPAAIVAALRRALAAPERLAAMGAAGFARLARFAPERVLPRLLDDVETVRAAAREAAR
jgi:glycosyltransferase involved in cell wall biosynthesis